LFLNRNLKIIPESIKSTAQEHPNNLSAAFKMNPNIPNSVRPISQRFVDASFKMQKIATMIESGETITCLGGAITDPSRFFVSPHEERNLLEHLMQLLKY
jgi:hypothetical protein